MGGWVGGGGLRGGGDGGGIFAMLVVNLVPRILNS